MSICIGCGLCCDGTVVDHLAVADESDLGQPLRSLGVELIVMSDPPVIALPCPAVVDGRCTVHDLHRPAACAQFECSVSRAVIDSTLSVDAARSVIAETITRRSAVAAGRTDAAGFERWIDRNFRWWVEPTD